MTLREEHNKRVDADRFDQRGFAKITCLDDEDSHLQKQFEDETGERLTMVPRSRTEGGIMGLLELGDRKYGEGSTRRWIGDNEEVVKEEENFRPDGGKLPPIQSDQ